MRAGARENWPVSLAGKQHDKLHNLTLLRFLTDSMVDIFVGAERTKFHLHRDLLCNRSDYFRACFVGDFKEAQQRELSLPEDNAESFELFVTWLYGTHLKKISLNDELPAYFGLAVLANKLCLEYLQNQATDHILRFYRTNPRSVDEQYLRYVYQSIRFNDLFHRLPLALVVWIFVESETAELTGEYKKLIREGGDLAVDFTSLLSMFYFAKGGSRNIAELDLRRASNCSLHAHSSTPVCSRRAK